MADKVLTYQSIEFSRMHSGGIERERAGNRVQLEDATGNPYTAIPVTSSDMLTLLQQIKAILDDTITVSGTVAITSSTLNSILTVLQGTLTTYNLMYGSLRRISGNHIMDSSCRY